MEINQLKKFINKDIVDFTELVIENYRKLDIDETDAIILIKLQKLIDKDIAFISPNKLSESLSISGNTTAKRLDKMIDRGFVSVSLIKGENGKERESYNLDRVYELILMNDFNERKGIEKEVTIEQEIVELFESEFKKPLSVLDIQVITKWLNEDNYTKDQIKDALFVAVKARKLNIKYVDGILLNTEEETQVTPARKTNLMRDFHKLWEK
jgi:DNA replication protein